MKKLCCLFFFAFLITYTAISLCAPTVLWDLGGVLFKANKPKMAYHEIGFKNILWHAVRDFQNPTKLQHRIFEVLYHLGKQQPDNPAFDYHSGLELPQIMCDWLEGKIHSETIITNVYSTMDKLDQHNFFVSSREKELLKKAIAAMFSPEILAKYMEPITPACPLLDTLRQSDYEQFILSNWDRASFDELFMSPHGQTIFKYFKPENIVISGKCGIMKPKKEIFEFVLTEFGLNPLECIFIDDQPENIKAAQMCGMQTILFDKNMNFNTLYEQIIRMTDSMNNSLSFSKAIQECSRSL